MRSSCKGLCLFFAIYCWHSAYAQTGKLMFTDLKLHSGFHLYTGEYLEEELSHGFGAAEIRVGWQPNKSESWHSRYNYPYFGFGWYSGIIGDVSVLGQPNAWYTFIGFPVGGRKSLSFNPEIAMGLTYGLESYSPDENPWNDALGAEIAVYFNLNLGLNYEISRRLDLIAGIDLTHFSNARMYQPNHGLNMIGANAGLRYHFVTGQNKENLETDATRSYRIDYSEADRSKIRLNENNLLSTLGFGVSQNEPDAGTDVHHFNFSGILEYQHFFSDRHGTSIGLDYFYDGSMLPWGREPNILAGHLGYDFRFYKFSIRLQLGTYFHAPENRMGTFFMRPAFKYDMLDRFYWQLGIKTLDGAKADWIEFGFGYRLFHKKQPRN